MILKRNRGIEEEEEGNRYETQNTNRKQNKEQQQEYHVMNLRENVLDD